jgi:selenide,water dikinase
VATVDFITPICDDPAEFGAIAAANSVSDVHAMGARPVLALAITCFPSQDRPLEELGEILRGGAETFGAVGVPVVGGHSVEDQEMKFGYAVIGLAPADGLWRNSTARPGDRLLLTKALGTGILAAAARSRKEEGAPWRAAVEQMKRTNASAAQALDPSSVHAATDVTGFGLAGHAAEMARGSCVTLRMRATALPVLDGALHWAARGCLTRSRETNREYAGEQFHAAASLDPALLEIVFDAQTSGGLLLSVDPDSDARARLEAAGCLAAEIGVVEEHGEHAVILE